MSECDYYSDDKTELTYPTLSFDCHEQTHNCQTLSLGINESIPFIDQFDDNSEDPTDEVDRMDKIDKRQISSDRFPRPEEAEKAIHTLQSSSIKNVPESHCCCHAHTSHCQLQKLSEDNASISRTPPRLIEKESKNHEDGDSDEGEDISILSAGLDKKESHDTENSITPQKIHPIMPELNLDLTGLNSDTSSDDSTVEKCWKSPEDIRLGCGRVAALAKHFSELGDAGLIKFKSVKLGTSRQFVSEPDFASPRYLGGDGRPDLSKSETDLLKADKSVATTPERAWSMILLDIHAKNGIDSEHSDAHIQDSGFSDGKLKKSDSKLSLAEQEEIIKQLQEFSNLDNINAPLYIPNCENARSNACNSSLSSSLTVQGHWTNSHEAIDSSKLSMSLENFTQGAPRIMSTVSISPVSTRKTNKLEKYWSLKDLIPSDEPVNEKSRVTSDPQLFHEDAHYVHIKSVNLNKLEMGNVSIESRISVSEDDKNNKVCITSGTRECGSSPVNFPFAEGEIIPRKTKFPNSFIRTKIKSKSDDKLTNKKLSFATPEQEMPTETSKSCENIELSALPKSQAMLNEEFRKKLSNTRVSVESPSKRCKRISSSDETVIPIRSVRDSKIVKPIKKKSLMILRKKSKSDLDISERKPTPRFERGDWIFRDFSSLEIDNDSRKLDKYRISLFTKLAHAPGSVIYVSS